VTGRLPYVSRGGRKLEGALRAFSLDVAGLSAIDVGASTGGFTDCLLQRGAARVLAVDVGTGQLHPKLRHDPRVTCREGTDVRQLDAVTLPFAPDLVVIDASFVSLAILADSLAALTPPGARLVALVKPQFEVGPEAARRGKGVIRDESLRQGAIARARDALTAAGFEISCGTDSQVAGPEGNVEHFLLAARL
jgi:23S rRNA (cytidine1920-2'-O)/16S rRNA (cytidine1409-2'-O)-methyltransferase